MLCVFDKFTAQDRFHTCGERILKPLSCTSTEELNGKWELEMQYLMTDNDDAWRFLTPYNIIKNCQGQLFPIYKIQRKMSQDGRPILSVNARHLFYHLNDKIVTDVSAENLDASSALSTTWSGVEWGTGEGLVDYWFYYNTNITGINSNIKFHGVSVAYAILGAPESLVNLYSGELFRDNFYFSINSRKEGYKDNAFNLIHGFNMSGITETVDYTDTITEIRSRDNYGNESAISTVPNGSFPHQVRKFITLSYSGESNFDADTGKYFGEYSHPKTSYEVQFEDLKKTNKAKDWEDIERLAVGDTGQIYSPLLGISTTQKIISRTIDEITGKVKSVKLGDFRQSPLNPDRYSKILAVDDASSRRLDRLESAFSATEDIDHFFTD